MARPNDYKADAERLVAINAVCRNTHVLSNDRMSAAGIVPQIRNAGCAVAGGGRPSRGVLS
jgi:hypothetical protein